MIAMADLVEELARAIDAKTRFCIPRDDAVAAAQACLAVVEKRIEELTAERDALKHDFDRLAERENQYLNESERFAGAFQQTTPYREGDRDGR